VAHGHVFGGAGSGVRTRRVLGRRVRGRVWVEWCFDFCRRSGEGGGRERERPGIDDLVSIRVCYLYLLPGFDEGGCSAAGGDGLEGGHGGELWDAVVCNLNEKLCEHLTERGCCLETGRMRHDMYLHPTCAVASGRGTRR